MTTNEIDNKRNALIEEKSKLGSDLNAVKRKLMVTMPQYEYVRTEAIRRDIVVRIQQIDAEIAVLNTRKHVACQAENQEKREERVPWIKQIIELRDEYQLFAADATRSPTMRRMASEFVVKLSPIIRAALSKKHTEPAH